MPTRRTNADEPTHLPGAILLLGARQLLVALGGGLGLGEAPRLLLQLLVFLALRVGHARPPGGGGGHGQLAVDGVVRGCMPSSASFLFLSPQPP